MLTNEQIVLYNKYFDKSTRAEKYQPVIIPAVYWEGAKIANTVASGLENADSIKIIIPRTILNYVDKEYIEPIKFKRFSDDLRKNYFTIAPGDRVIKGNKIYDIKELDKEVEAFTLTKVDEKLFGSYHMQHYEVGAS